MVKIANYYPPLQDALWSMGIAPEATRRVVIDIRAGYPVKVFVEFFGEEEVLNALLALDGILIEGTQSDDGGNEDDESREEVSQHG